jgi:diguanylate cyclase (GGDEF)-like protein
MDDTNTPPHPRPTSFPLTVATALAALGATFWISNTAFPFESKTALFAVIVVAFLGLSAAVNRLFRPASPDTGAGQVITDNVEGKLFALEEASEFFGASLKSADMFRLVASRVNEIVPFSAVVLYLADADAKTIELKYAFGENPDRFANAEVEINRSLASKAFLSRMAQLDVDNQCDRRVFPEELMRKFSSSVAVPLLRGSDLFGILVIYSKAGKRYDGSSVTLAEAVAVRIAPLLASSFAFESSVSNALTDTLTSLPNERAFFLVLENQIAESQRFRDERPLTVLAVDIRNFDELNAQHGHVTGDGILEFASILIKKQLRQMDVLTRSAGDEFLAVLPTAAESVAEEVRSRISRAFVVTPFEKLSGEKLFLELNFGSATFWRDGETAPELLRAARLRKDQDKRKERGRVLWFPKDYVN